MKSHSFLSLCLGLVPIVEAHYVFGRLVLDGQITETWEYVREIRPAPGIPDPGLAMRAPNTDPDSPDLRCGRGASTLWSPVRTATVTAGDRIGFFVGKVPEVNPESDEAYMYHPGFASAWLSKDTSGDLESYEGDGDWIKIFSFVQPTEQSRDWNSPEWKPRSDLFKSLWGTFMLDSANFTIPESTPAGKYLLRFEHVFPNPLDAQFYVNCAHIEILNPGVEVTPASTVKIPGVYTRGQPDVYFSTYDLAFETNFDISSFVPPQPEPWSG